MRKHLKNQGKYFFSIGLFALFATFSQADGQELEKNPDTGLLLTVTVDDNYVYFAITNQSRKPKKISYPFIFSPGRRGEGLELAFRSVKSREGPASGLCAMIEWGPDQFPKKYLLLPDAVVGLRFRLEEVRMSHCLEYEAYEMTVRYHSLIAAEDPSSEPDPVVMDIDFRKIQSH